MKRHTLKQWLTVLVISLAFTVAGLNAGETAPKEEKKKGYLGVNIETIKSGDDSKVKILRVLPDSAAAKAGLEAEDVIVKINGTVIDTSSGLVHEIVQRNAGEEVAVTVLRDGEAKELLATLSPKADAATKVARRFAFVVPDEERAFLGITPEKLGPQMARYFKVEQGVLIEEVIEDSPAEAAGLEAGDIIQSLDGEPVTDPKTLRMALRKYEPGDEMSVEIVRREKPMNLDVTLGKAEKRVQEFGYNYEFGNGKAFIIDVDGGDMDINIESLHEAEGMLQENMKFLEEQLHELKEQLPQAPEAPKPPRKQKKKEKKKQ